MSVECLGLADFLLIAEAITGTQVEALARQPGLHRAEHALSAPNAGIGQSEYYPSFADNAAAMSPSSELGLATSGSFGTSLVESPHVM